jgi:hypothetical protein
LCFAGEALGFIGDFAISLEMHWILLKRNAINANVLRVALYLTPIGKHTANNETRRICYQVNGCFDINIVSQCIESSKKTSHATKGSKQNCYLFVTHHKYTNRNTQKHRGISTKVQTANAMIINILQESYSLFFDKCLLF